MTLKQKINFFKSEAKRFIAIHGLINYAVFFDSDENPECRASCEMPDSNRQLTIGYNETWLRQTDDCDEISKTAYHEVIELLLAKLRLMASEKESYYSNVMIDEEIHRIIRLLENIYFDKIKKIS
jgi:hypothetical protein